MAAADDLGQGHELRNFGNLNLLLENFDKFIVCTDTRYV